jgi:tRNA-splicing ligase RtcB
MIAVPFPELRSRDLSLSVKQSIQSAIRDAVPSGFNSFKTPQKGAKEAIENINKEISPSSWLKENICESDKTLLQLGTLGGGNHFIEVVHDESDTVWVMLHSGSRYAGKATAEFYNDVAKKKIKTSGTLLLLSF